MMVQHQDIDAALAEPGNGRGRLWNHIDRQQQPDGKFSETFFGHHPD